MLQQLAIFLSIPGYWETGGSRRFFYSMFMAPIFPFSLSNLKELETRNQDLLLPLTANARTVWIFALLGVVVFLVFLLITYRLYNWNADEDKHSCLKAL